MMKIVKKVEGNELTISIEGRLDFSTTPKLEEELAFLDGIEKVIFDFEKLEYISSSGLAVILKFKKKVNAIKIINCNPEVLEILNITGFSGIMDVEVNH